MYKNVLEKLKNIKLDRKTIITLIGAAVGALLFMFLGQKSSCAIGSYKYTDLNGKEGIADTCSYDNGVAICEVGKSVIVVSDYHKNKWCN